MVEAPGIEGGKAPSVHVVSGAYDACTTQIHPENPNDSIPIGPGFGPENEDGKRHLEAPATVAANAREGLIAELARRVEGLALAGDTSALAVAVEALQRLVVAPGGSSAPVVDLATRRLPRGSR